MGWGSIATPLLRCRSPASELLAGEMTWPPTHKRAFPSHPSLTFPPPSHTPAPFSHSVGISLTPHPAPTEASFASPCQPVPAFNCLHAHVAAGASPLPFSFPSSLRHDIHATHAACGTIPFAPKPPSRSSISICCPGIRRAVRRSWALQAGLPPSSKVPPTRGGPCARERDSIWESTPPPAPPHPQPPPKQLGRSAGPSAGRAQTRLSAFSIFGAPRSTHASLSGARGGKAPPVATSSLESPPSRHLLRITRKTRDHVKDVPKTALRSPGVISIKCPLTPRRPYSAYSRVRGVQVPRNPSSAVPTVFVAGGLEGGPSREPGGARVPREADRACLMARVRRGPRLPR